jgi:hypothetical protein
MSELVRVFLINKFREIRAGKSIRHSHSVVDAAGMRHYYVDVTPEERDYLIAGEFAAVAPELPQPEDLVPEELLTSLDDVDIDSNIGTPKGWPESYICPKHGIEHTVGTSIYVSCMPAYLAAKDSEETKDLESEATKNSGKGHKRSDKK